MAELRAAFQEHVRSEHSGKRTIKVVAQALRRLFEMVVAGVVVIGIVRGLASNVPDFGSPRSRSRSYPQWGGSPSSLRMSHRTEEYK